jgi:S-DNA-T family DNA segregation ATPase FtsK/SpoIIIE
MDRFRRRGKDDDDERQDSPKTSRDVGDGWLSPRRQGTEDRRTERGPDRLGNRLGPGRGQADDQPSGSGFLRRGGSKADDKAPDKSSGGGFLRRGGGKDDEPRAAPTGRFSSSRDRRPDKKEEDKGGRFGRFRPGGRKEESKKDDDKPRRSPFLNRGAADTDDEGPVRRSPLSPGTERMRGSRPGGGFGDRDRSSPIGGSRPGGGIGDRDRSSPIGGARPRSGFGDRDRSSPLGGARPGGSLSDRPRSSSFGRRDFADDEADDDETGASPRAPLSRSRPSPLGSREGSSVRDRPGGTGDRDRPSSFGGARPGGFGDRDRSSPIGGSRPGGGVGDRDRSSPLRSSRPGGGIGDRDRSSPLRSSRPGGGIGDRDRPGTADRSRSPFGVRDKKPGEDAKPGQKEKDKSKSRSRIPFVGRRSKDKPETAKPGAAPARTPSKRPLPSARPPSKRPQSTGKSPVRPSKKPSTPKSARARSRAKPLPQTQKKGALTVHQGLDFDRKLDLIGLALVAFSLVTFFAVIPSISMGLLPEPQAGLTGTLNHLLSQLFGWGKLVLPVAGFSVGVWLMAQKFEDTGIELDYFRVIGMLSLYACALAWLQMIELVGDTAPTVEAFRPISYHLAVDMGRGGGWFGHQIYLLLLSQLLDFGTLSVLIAWLIMGLMLTFDVSVVELLHFVTAFFAMFGIRHRRTKREAAAIAAAETVTPVRPGEEASATAPAQIPLPAAAVAAAAPVAAGAEAAPTSSPQPTSPNQPPVRPVIRRRNGGEGEAGESLDDKAATVPPSVEGVAAKLDTKSQVEDSKPARRRLPHLRRSPEEAEDTKAVKESDTAQTELNEDSTKRRLGFLRRRSKEPAADAKESARPEAGAPPGIPVPPGRSENRAAVPAEDAQAADETERPSRFGRFLRGKRSSEEEKAETGESTPAAATGDSPRMPVRDRAQTPGRPARRSLESRPQRGSDGDNRPADKQDEPDRSGVVETLGAVGAAVALDRLNRRPGSTPARDHAERIRRDEDLTPTEAQASPTGDSGQLPIRDRLRPPGGPPRADRPVPEFRRRPPGDAETDNAARTNEPPASPPGRFNLPVRPDSMRRRFLPDQNGEAAPDTQSEDKVSGPVPVEPSSPPKLDIPAPAAESAPPATSEGPPVRRPSLEPPFRRPNPTGTPPGPAGPRAAPSAPAAAESPAETSDVLPDRNRPAPAQDENTTVPAAEMKVPVEEEQVTQPAEQPTTPQRTLPAERLTTPQRTGPPQRTLPAERPAMPARSIPAERPLQEHNRTERERPRIGGVAGRSAQAPAAALATGENAPQTTAKAHTPGSSIFELPDFRKILRKGSEQEINDEILLDKARVIEDTLISFGAPGKVVEVNPGPVITQFGVEPDYLISRSGKRTRVKVSSIARLDADMALALAAKSIRIEAPVPGKGFVGIEVPNDEVQLVSLYDIMDSPEFRRIDSKLRIALGLSVDGSPISADLTAMPHLLIAGTTGSGKSVCVNAIISCLLLSNTPDDVQFIMVDPKRVELTGYNGIPHLVAPVVVDLERIVGVLQWVQREMEERYRKFSSISARNILDYNRKIGPNERRMPYYIVIVDELADLMMLAPDETERLLARLAQMARATGIHLIISTQRPSVDIITGLIKANFPARIAFAVASSVDSRVILDQPGAEKLLGRGDMLYQSPDAAAPLRMQGVFVSDEEINRITSYWKGQLLEQADASGVRERLASPSREITFETAPAARPASSVPRRKSSPPAQPAFWDDTGNVTQPSTLDDADNFNGEDELYGEAVELVQRLNKASISLLQRRLRIGYTRAARLIDMMEAEGIVGPAESGSKPREVIKHRRESGDD